MHASATGNPLPKIMESPRKAHQYKIGLGKFKAKAPEKREEEEEEEDMSPGNPRIRLSGIFFFYKKACSSILLSFFAYLQRNGTGTRMGMRSVLYMYVARRRAFLVGVSEKMLLGVGRGDEDRGGLGDHDQQSNRPE